MGNVQLSYKTFQELLDEVSIDFHTFSNEGMIEPAQLIKIAAKVNYDLGLKINQTKTDIIDIYNNKARLPDDFYVLNYAVLCGGYKIIKQEIPRGTHREDITIHLDNPVYPTDPSACCENTTSKCPRVFTTKCGVVEELGFETRYYEEFENISFKQGKFVDKNSYNTHLHSHNTAEIKNGFIYTNINHGRMTISYEGNLEDDEGNLLVLDHPMINEYYEYAIKQRILENLYINGEDVTQRMQLIEQRLRVARNNALSIVNTPDFNELRSIHDFNRKAMHNKYYSMFAS